MIIKKLDKTKREIMTRMLMQSRESIDLAWQSVRKEEGGFDEAQMCFALWYMINEAINLLTKLEKEEDE